MVLARSCGALKLSFTRQWLQNCNNDNINNNNNITSNNMTSSTNKLTVVQ